MNTTSPPQSSGPPVGQSPGQSGGPGDSGPRVTREQVQDLSRLRRAHQGRMVAGVAEGLSRHLDIDPLLIRVIFGALTVFGGAGIVLYVLAWLTIPDEDAYDSPASRALRQDPDRTMGVGLAVAGIAGAVTLLGAIGFATPRPFAVITLSVVALVVFTVFSRRSGHQPAPVSTRDEERTAPVPDGEPTTPLPDDEATTQLPDDEATTQLPDEEATTELPSDESTTETTESPQTTTVPPYAALASSPTAVKTRGWWQRRDSGAAPPPPAQTAPGPSRPAPPPRPPRPKSRLTPITLAAMALALGGVWFADAAGADVHPSVYPGVVLGLTAAALLVGTWFGRAKLLIPVGILAALLTAATVVIGPGPYGERVYEPSTAAAVKPTYEHGAGRLVVNLEDVSDPQALDGRSIKVESRVGLVQVVVPTSVDAQITSHVEAGDIEGPALTEDEGNGEQRAVMDARHDGRPLVNVDVDLKFGQIEILRVDCPKLAIAKSGDTSSQDLSTMTWKGDLRDPAACN